MQHVCREMGRLTVSGRSWWSGKPIRVVVNGGVVESVSPVDEIDSRFILTPVFFDSQVNGYAGVDFSDPWLDENKMERAISLLSVQGVRQVLPTVVTNDLALLINSMKILGRLQRSFPEIAGIHLEGPYIAPEDGPRGAHRKDFVKEPDIREFDRLFEASGGNIRLVTLAPELPGAVEFIRHAVSLGVVVGIGHTAASEDDINCAVATGATWSTHVGNGAHSKIRRHPNYIWSQLARDELTASIIVDGFHLPPSVVKCFWRCKGPERTALTTDALSLSGMHPGDYEFIGQTVTLIPEGVVVLKGTDYLAGAVKPLIENMENLVAFAGASIDQAIGAASINSGRVLLPDHNFGEPVVGKKAEFNLIKWDRGRIEVIASLLGENFILSEDVCEDVS